MVIYVNSRCFLPTWHPIDSHDLPYVSSIYWFTRGHLEISVRAGIILRIVPPRHVFLTTFLSSHQKESRSLFKELYLLYFVQSFAYIIAYDLFEDVIWPTFFSNNSFCSVRKLVSRPPRPIARMAPVYLLYHDCWALARPSLISHWQEWLCFFYSRVKGLTHSSIEQKLCEKYNTSEAKCDLIQKQQTG